VGTRITVTNERPMGIVEDAYDTMGVEEYGQIQSSETVDGCTLSEEHVTMEHHVHPFVV